MKSKSISALFPLTILLLSLVTGCVYKPATTVAFKGEYFEEYPEEGMLHGAYGTFIVLQKDRIDDTLCTFLAQVAVPTSGGQYGGSWTPGLVSGLSSDRRFCNLLSVGDGIAFKFSKERPDYPIGITISGEGIREKFKEKLIVL